MLGEIRDAIHPCLGDWRKAAATRAGWLEDNATSLPEGWQRSDFRSCHEKRMITGKYQVVEEMKRCILCKLSSQAGRCMMELRHATRVMSCMFASPGRGSRRKSAGGAEGGAAEGTGQAETLWGWLGTRRRLQHAELADSKVEKKKSKAKQSESDGFPSMSYSWGILFPPCFDQLRLRRTRSLSEHKETTAWVQGIDFFLVLWLCTVAVNTTHLVDW